MPPPPPPPPPGYRPPTDPSTTGGGGFFGGFGRKVGAAAAAQRASTPQPGDIREVPIEAGYVVVQELQFDAQGNLAWTQIGIKSPQEADGAPGGDDSLRVAQTLIDFYAQRIRAGELTVEAATAQFTRDLGVAEEERQRFMQPQQEATTRAGIIARDILPAALPAGFQPNLPLIGNIPTTPLNLGGLFSQGLGPLGGMPPMPPVGQVPTPSIPMPNLPGLPGF